MSPNSPMTLRPIPALANKRGSTRSERRPLMGEKTAINTGWTISMAPACCGVMPWMYWRYKLSSNVIDDVAQ